MQIKTAPSKRNVVTQYEWESKEWSLPLPNLLKRGTRKEETLRVVALTYDSRKIIRYSSPTRDKLTRALSSSRIDTQYPLQAFAALEYFLSCSERFKLLTFDCRKIPGFFVYCKDTVFNTSVNNLHAEFRPRGKVYYLKFLSTRSEQPFKFFRELEPDSFTSWNWVLFFLQLLIIKIFNKTFEF